MPSKKKLKQFHLFVPNDSYYGAMDYAKSFVTVDEAIEYTKGLGLSESADIMQTAEDGSLIDFCSVDECGVVFKSGKNGDGIWWAKQGKDDHWEEQRQAGRTRISSVPGRSIRQWEVRTEEDGEWQLREKRS